MKLVRKVFKWLGILLGVIIIAFVILLFVPEKETVKPITPRTSTEYWNMSEGFKIAYTHLKSKIKEPSKSPVIFLHGGPGGYVHSSIINTLNNLTDLGYDVYLYDQRGSGLSDRLENYSDINFEKHLLDLDEIITEKIKANKVILIGQSFGSNIISHYSVRHADKIEKIIFSSPGSFKPHRQVDGKFVSLDSVFPTPDSLKFIEPYRFLSDVDKMAAKPKAIVAVLGAFFLDKKLTE